VDAGHPDDDDDATTGGGDTDDDARDDAPERGTRVRVEGFRAGVERTGRGGGRRSTAFPRIARFESDDAGGRRRCGRDGCRAIEWDDVDVDVEWIG